jgi:hypothetical protein
MAPRCRGPRTLPQIAFPAEQLDVLCGSGAAERARNDVVKLEGPRSAAVPTPPIIPSPNELPRIGRDMPGVRGLRFDT